jgi:hypothetical protein
MYKWAHFISEYFYYFNSEDFNTYHFRTIYLDSVECITIHCKKIGGITSITSIESFHAHLDEQLHSAHPSTFVFIDANSNVRENEKS